MARNHRELGRKHRTISTVCGTIVISVRALEVSATSAVQRDSDLRDTLRGSKFFVVSRQIVVQNSGRSSHKRNFLVANRPRRRVSTSEMSSQIGTVIYNIYDLSRGGQLGAANLREECQHHSQRPYA